LKWKPDIFEFLNYREYLGAYYIAAKQNMPAFSYRYFSRKAGYASPNFLKLVIEGKRNISADSIERFAKALQLSRREKSFFTNLVAFGQAETAKDKNLAFEKVAGSRRFKKARRIDQAYFTYLSHWYIPVIREMVTRGDFNEDPRWIADQLLPPISAKQASESLDLLMELGFLIRDESGALALAEVTLTTGHEVRSLGVGNYHRQMLIRAAESIELVEAPLRDLSAMTICIRPERITEFKERIHQLCEVLMEAGERDEEPECVYQLNIQFFPVNKVRKEDDQ
jgi:uncharacterized protein (TIGR02147 family)